MSRKKTRLLFLDLIKFIFKITLKETLAVWSIYVWPSMSSGCLFCFMETLCSSFINLYPRIPNIEFFSVACLRIIFIWFILPLNVCCVILKPVYYQIGVTINLTVFSLKFNMLFCRISFIIITIIVYFKVSLVITCSNVCIDSTENMQMKKFKCYFVVKKSP